MGGRLRRGLGAAAAGGLLVTGIAVMSGMSAAGVELDEGTDPVYEAFGTLTISLNDRDGTLTLDKADGTTMSQSILTQQPCAQLLLDALPDGDLLVFTPIVGGATSTDFTVQLPDDAIGVNDGTNCGTPAGHIDDDELLDIELGPFFDQFADDGGAPTVFIHSASVVIEKDFNNSGDLTVGYDGGDQGSPIGVSTGVQTIQLEPADVFTSLSLGSTSNKDARGLELGGVTSFELVTGTGETAVDCGEQLSDIGDEGEVAITATVVRGANADPNPNSNIDYSATCTEVGAVVEIQSDDPLTAENEDRVFWNVGLVSVEDGTFQPTSSTIRIEWAPVSATLAGQPTKIDYDAEGPAEYTDSLWCESFTETTDDDGDPVFDVDFPAYSGPGNIDGEAPWCTYARSDVIVGDQVYVIEDKAGRGDPWGQFR